MWLGLALALSAGDGLAEGLRPLVEGHCVACHAGPRPKGELDLAALLAGAEPAPGETLAAIRAVLRADDMPPPREPRPPAELVSGALTALERALGSAEAPRMRRLNRARYENAVRDLLGVAYPARALFPPDDVGTRFDNEAASAGASDLHVERWVEAAEEIAARALPDESGSETRELAAEELALEGGAGLRDGGHVALFSRARASASVVLPRAGRYRMEVVGWGDLAGDERPRITFDLDRAKLGVRELSVEAPAVETLALELEADGGPHEIGASFLNDYYAPEHPDPGERDRNAHIARLVLTGPLDPPPETAFTRAVAADLARGGLAGALERLGGRVWRRPLTPDEHARLLALSDPAANDRARLRTALVALLASPHFLYEVESAHDGGADGSGRAFELATRLAGFLWASVPDEALLDAAASGALARADERERQVERMLRDARARALVTEFGAQWLGWGELARTTPDRRRFPAADADLVDSMRQECEAFFEAMLREARPLEELLAADFAFVDERLAALYGIEGVVGEGVRRVPLPDGGTRGGVLGQAGLLTVTSNPTRTAPVARGKWILETLLGRRVPPPPPGAGVLTEAAAETPASLRAELARHRADPDCAACHAELDPLGLALEGFDAIGRARGEDVDARGELPDGTVLDGVDGLRRHLLASDALAPAAAEALFVYALGREPEPAERERLRADLRTLPARERTLPGLIRLVVRQPAFLGDPTR